MSAVEPDRQAARAEQAAKQKRSARDEIDELLWLMSDPRGRHFVWRLLQRFGIYQLSYVQGDPAHSAFNEGRRNEGLKLLSQIMENCPARFTEMQKEAKTYERRNSSSSSSTGQ